MSDTTTHRNHPIPLWRARAVLVGGDGHDAAYGFGGPDVAEAVGTADEMGAALTSFLNGLGWQEVQAARLATGCCAVRLEVEPQAGGAGTWTGQAGEGPHEDAVRWWEATARVGNSRGVFDAAYAYGHSHGDAGHLLGTAQALGAELTVVLKRLTYGDVEDMKYHTDRFYLELVIELPAPP
jgi:hypothetical protein